MLTFSILNTDISKIKSIIEKGLGWYSEPMQSLRNIECINLPMQKGGLLPSSGVFYNPIVNEKKLIFTSNLSDGWDSLLYCITKNNDIDYLSFRLIEGDFPLLEMKLVRSGKDARLIRTMKEFKWNFYEVGELLWFEDSDYYLKRFISKRVTYDLLLSYSKKNGIDFSSRDFFRTKIESLWVDEVRRFTSGGN